MLSKPAKRDLRHRRRLIGNGYKREDGLWDIEVFLTDEKSYTFNNKDRGYIAAGEPLHEMAIRLTLTSKFEIVDIEAVINQSPYSICPAAVDKCYLLKGEFVKPGFNKRVVKLLGGGKGCRHISDMLAYAANVSFQSINHNDSIEERELTLENLTYIKEKFVNSCYAYREDGEVYNRYKEMFEDKLKEGS
jgi:hypothetical protein